MVKILLDVHIEGHAAGFTRISWQYQGMTRRERWMTDARARSFLLVATRSLKRMTSRHVRMLSADYKLRDDEAEAGRQRVARAVTREHGATFTT